MEGEREEEEEEKTGLEAQRSWWFGGGVGMEDVE